MVEHRKPIVGITPDIYIRDVAHGSMPTWRVAETYATCISRAGGVPMVFSPMASHAVEQAAMVDAVVFTGGDDPIMEDFGVATHPQSERVIPERQSFERALFDCLWNDGPHGGRDIPVLGVCLGMQYMALRAGGILDQHLPETTATASDHWENEHQVSGDSNKWAFGTGEIHSKHRQAMSDSGSLTVLARAHDGVIEAVGDVDRRFWLGVQWHPERTAEPALGQEIFNAMVKSARPDR